MSKVKSKQNSISKVKKKVDSSDSEDEQPKPKSKVKPIVKKDNPELKSGQVKPKAKSKAKPVIKTKTITDTEESPPEPSPIVIPKFDKRIEVEDILYICDSIRKKKEAKEIIRDKDFDKLNSLANRKVKTDTELYSDWVNLRKEEEEKYKAPLPEDKKKPKKK